MSHLEIGLLAVYGALGPQVWAGYGQALMAGRRKLLLMKRPPLPLKGEPPGVTILVPAKDEGSRIRTCIESCLKQDYPNFDVIAIDDRSTDNTGAVMDEIARSDSRLTVVHVTKPPQSGWTGKNNALHQGTKRASGEWLLFVDSDVVLEPQALDVAMGVVRRKQFDMLSLLPRIESHSFWEGLLIPLCGAAASTMYMIALNNKGHLPKQAFANGQFMLMSRRSYDTIGGHETVRDRYCEDVEIARLMKSHGMRPRVSWGNEYCSVRMYSSLGGIIRGWSRIYYAARVGSPWRVLMALAFLLLCCFPVYPALAWGVWRTVHPSSTWHGLLGPLWLVTAISHLLLMTVYLGRMYQWSGNRRRHALLFPVAGALLGYTLLRALRMCITRRVEWRGTAYAHRMQQIPIGQPPAGAAAVRDREPSESAV